MEYKNYSLSRSRQSSILTTKGKGTPINIVRIMKRMLHIIILATGTFCSCNSLSIEQQKQNLKQIEHHVDHEANISDQEIDTVSTVKAIDETKSNTTIEFSDLLVSIQDLAIFNPEKMDSIQGDTVEIEVELGESIEGSFISILSDHISDLRMEQRYETSATIMNEGPHCDLTEWKHFNSAWKSLKQNGKGQFLSIEYTDAEHTVFPEVSMDELKRKVKEQCGEEWFKLLVKVKSPTEYPCAIGISRYFLRITGIRKESGKKVTKLIVFKTPMGC